MTDQELALQAVSDAQRILEEYLEPRPHNDQRILDRLVEVLERPGVVVAVDRLQRANGGEKTRRGEPSRSPLVVRTYPLI
jgi:hypothetical protein